MLPNEVAACLAHLDAVEQMLERAGNHSLTLARLSMVIDCLRQLEHLPDRDADKQTILRVIGAGSDGLAEPAAEPTRTV